MDPTVVKRNAKVKANTNPYRFFTIFFSPAQNYGFIQYHVHQIINGECIPYQLNLPGVGVKAQSRPGIGLIRVVLLWKAICFLAGGLFHGSAFGGIIYYSFQI